MKRFLKQFVRDKLTELNERFDTPLVLRELTITKLFENAPANQTQVHYAVSVAVNTEVQANNIVRTANVRIDFCFALAGKDALDADTIYDRYLYNFLRMMTEEDNQYSNTDLSQWLKINDISSVSISNDDRVENIKYLPTIEMQLMVTDQSSEEIITTDQAG